MLPVMANAPRSARATFFGRYCISLALATVLMVGGVAAVNHGINDRVAKIHRIQLTVAPAPPEGANFLIIGSDTRAAVDDPTQVAVPGADTTAGGQRSDTLMVAHVEPGSQHTFVVSFPRDLMVDVPGLSGKNRINEAYAVGGPDLVIQTLKANFGIDINHYLEVDFKSFQAVVDAIGRVEVYIPGELRDVATDGGTGFHTVFGAGCYGLNGATALAYVRSRHMQIADPEGDIVDSTGKHWRLLDVRSDLDRIQRQQTFIRKLAGVAIQRSLGDPFLATEVADNVLQFITADQNFGRSDVNALIRAFRTVNVNDTNAVRFETLPTDPDPDNPNVTLVPDDELAAPVIAELRTFGDNTPAPPTVAPDHVKVQVLDGAGAGDAVGGGHRAHRPRVLVARDRHRVEQPRDHADPLRHELRGRGEDLARLRARRRPHPRQGARRSGQGGARAREELPVDLGAAHHHDAGPRPRRTHHDRRPHHDDTAAHHHHASGRPVPELTRRTLPGCKHQF